MEEYKDSQRLSQISTLWGDLFQAHRFETDSDRQVLGAMLQRYHRAAFRYLCAATGKEEVAADMFQEFAVMFLEGKFHHADPSKGRFRDYLKTALVNLVRKDANRAEKMILITDSALDMQAGEDTEELKRDEMFMASWRKTLLDRSWESLASVEQRTGTPYHTALKIHSENPKLSSTQLALNLTEMLRPREAYTDSGVRKILQRGRQMMSEMLVQEIAQSIPTYDLDIIEQELIELGFHAHCREEITKLRSSGKSVQRA